MQALQRSSQIASRVWGKSLTKPLTQPQTLTPALTRSRSILTEEQRKRRDAIRDKMQYPDDTPTYLRGGPMDKVLFGITCILATAGTLMTFYRVYERAQN